MASGKSISASTPGVYRYEEETVAAVYDLRGLGDSTISWGLNSGAGLADSGTSFFYSKARPWYLRAMFPSGPLQTNTRPQNGV
jgi:hypothetical protein